ncbi:MAG: hypothetical protein L3J12_01945 [Spirochaetales bacterium]|nr:hypothetical protein [Spirochaetales bacterium]
MNRSSVSAQLQNDYPGCNIYLDSRTRMIVAGTHRMSLLNSSAALESMNIFSRSGKSFYQAIAQLIYTQYDILPLEGSYADKLIVRKEDLDKYRIQKLAKEWGIGFLEDNNDILAVGVDDGVERELLLGDSIVEKIDLLEEDESVDDIISGYAVLEELKVPAEEKKSSTKGKIFEILEELESLEDEIPPPIESGSGLVDFIKKRILKRDRDKK